MKYKLVVCGGTFDLLHKGHKTFLDKAFSLSEKVLVGINTDQFALEHGKHPYQNQDERKAEVEKYLSEKGWLQAAEFHFHDNFADCPAVTDPNLEAIIVSEETIKGAQDVNEQRIADNLPELEIVSLPIVLAQDGKQVSSTRIRNGEINREGQLYVDPTWSKKIFILPDSLRSELKKPLGELLKTLPDSVRSAVAIGDITVQKFNESNLDQMISVVDFVVQRQKKFEQLHELGFEGELKTVRLENRAGQVNGKLFEVLKNAFVDNERLVIIIDGEEDLVVIPAILTAPLGYSIFYGQPNEGFVHVSITEELKDEVYNLLSNFNLS